VARLVVGGLSNPAIASALFISVATVKTHVSHILAKLGLDSRVQLASWVAGHDPGPPALARDADNMPLPVSSFVRCASELEQTTAVLGESRVVTLTGAGEVGTTPARPDQPAGSGRSLQDHPLQSASWPMPACPSARRIGTVTRTDPGRGRMMTITTASAHRPSGGLRTHDAYPA
jgi:hypothetical protein